MMEVGGGEACLRHIQTCAAHAHAAPQLCSSPGGLLGRIAGRWLGLCAGLKRSRTPFPRAMLIAFIGVACTQFGSSVCGAAHQAFDSAAFGHSRFPSRLHPRAPPLGWRYLRLCGDACGYRPTLGVLGSAPLRAQRWMSSPCGPGGHNICWCRCMRPPKFPPQALASTHHRCVGAHFGGWPPVSVAIRAGLACPSRALAWGVWRRLWLGVRCGIGCCGRAGPSKGYGG